MKEEDRNAFRFLFHIKRTEKHLRFTRVPFEVEGSPFLPRATLQRDCKQQGPEFEDTLSALKENTYVDTVMQTGGNDEENTRYKEQSTLPYLSLPGSRCTTGNQMLTFLKVNACQFQAKSLDTRGIKMMTHWSC